MRPLRRGDRYAFVSGMKKSGTNWASALIATHPDAVTQGELHLDVLREALHAYAAPGWIPVSGDDVETVWPDVARLVLGVRRRTQVATAGRAARRVLLVDHTPGPAVLHLGASARYVHIVRDVRDVIVSDTFHSMRLGEYPPGVAADQAEHVAAWRADPWYFSAHPDRLLHPAEVTRLARTWVDVVTSALDLAERRPELLLVMRYEDLHADVLGGRRSLLAFLGLDPAGAPADIDRMLRPGFDGRGERPAEFNRKGAVGDHRTYLSGADADEVERIAGALLRRLGYGEPPGPPQAGGTR